MLNKKIKISVIFMLIILLFTVHILYIPLPGKANASNQYLRVIDETTPFYKTPSDTTPLFYLPYTYYVKVLSDNGDFMHIECFGSDGFTALDGYVPANALFFDNLYTDKPYLSLKITTSETTVLYKDTFQTQPLQYIFANRELLYYGKLQNTQGNIYCVGYNEKIGYVKESCIFPFTIPPHPNELTFLEPEVPEEKPPVPEQQINTGSISIKIIIICCLVFAGIIALVVALNKKPKNSSASTYYDENDYE